MISGFMCACHGFMSAEIDGITYKSHQYFEAGSGREGWFTNAHLNEQFRNCLILFRHYHPLEQFDLYFGFNHSMTHKAKAPDGLDASKLNKSDGGASVQKQRNGWYDSVADGVTTRTIQPMQTEEGVQLGLLSILRARGKSCMKLPDGRYSQHELKKLCISCRDHTIKEDPTETYCMFGVLSKEPDFLAQKPWRAESVERNPGCCRRWCLNTL